MIVSVALSAPKPGIFLETVKYVLAIATPVEVVLLAISCDAECDRLRLNPTAYKLPSDGVAMFKMVGSQVGRLFMAGNDGNLYELDYSYVESPWAALVGGGSSSASHKCAKINHFYWNWTLVSIVPPLLRSLVGAEEGSLSDLMIDNVRHMLYTLSTTSVLSAIYLGAADDATTFVVKAFSIIEETRTFLLYNRNASESSPKADIFKDPKAPGFNVIGMYPVGITESKKVHLLVVLGNGIRIYLALRQQNRLYTDIPYQGAKAFIPAPTGIEIVHVRCPPSLRCLEQTQLDAVLPTDMENAWSHIPTYSAQLSISNSFYASGVLLLSQEKSNREPDELWSVYEDLVTRNHATTSSIAGSTPMPNLREGVSSALPPNMRTNGGTIYAMNESCSQIHYPAACRIRALYAASSTPLTSQSINQSSSYSHGQHYNQQLLPQQQQQSSTPLTANTAATSATPPAPPDPFLMVDYHRPSELPVTPAPALARSAVPKGSCLGYERSNLDNVALLGELCTQHIPSDLLSLQRKFLVLTNKGLHVLRKIRPVDTLYRNITQVNSQAENFSRYFLECYGPLQYCAMSVALACGVPCDAGGSSSSFDPRLFSSITGSDRLDTIQARVMATMLSLTDGPSYKKVGGVNMLSDTSSNTAAGFKDSRLVLDGATHEFFKSSAHEGIYLTLSRILRPIWLRPLVGKDNRLALVFRDPSLINQIRNPLLELKKLLKGYYPLAVMSDPHKSDFLSTMEQLETQHDLVYTIHALLYMPLHTLYSIL